MDQIVRNTGTLIANAVSGVTNVTVTHEWGEVVAQASATVSYTLTPTSIGVHRLDWKNGSGTILSTTFVESYVPIITSSAMSTKYPELLGAPVTFSRAEQQARKIIEKHTGQQFGPYIGKSLTLRGDGGDTLVLPMRLITLTEIVNNFDTDLTEMVEISPNCDEILQRQSRFRSVDFYETKRDVTWNAFQMFSDKYNFTITGNWGWEYVPQDVTIAGELLIAEIMAGSEASKLKEQGVKSAQMGDFSMSLFEGNTDTTGNSTVDKLLSPYVIINIGHI